MGRFGISRLWRDRCGAVAVLTALMMVMMLGSASLALDMSYLWTLKNRLQATADATSLAGAGRLALPGQTPNVTLVRSTALAFAGKNMPAAPHGAVLVEADVILGHWDGDTRTFTPHPDVTNPPGGETTNAVRTTTRRAAANGNPAPLFFARILRVYQSDIVTSAIAEAQAGSGENCVSNGIVAAQIVETGSTNQITNSFCVHGEEGVKVGSTNDFTGSNISMLELSMLLAGSDNIGIDECFDEPPGSSCVLSEQSLLPEMAQNVGTMITEIVTDLSNNLLSNLPGNVSISYVSTSLPSDPTGTGQWGIPGTAYVIDGIVDINSNRTLDNIVIVATEGISIGSDYTLTNAIIASRQIVQVGSYGTIGQSDFCSSGNGAVAILAAENLLVGSNTAINGAQLITAQTADLGSDQISAHGLAIQAAQNVKLGSQLQITGCPAAQLPFGPAVGLKFRLVN